MIKGSGEREHGSQEGRAADPAQHAFPGPRGADGRRDDSLAQQLAPHVLQRVPHLDQKHEVEQEEGVLGPGAGCGEGGGRALADIFNQGGHGTDLINLQVQEGRGEAEAVHTKHQSRLDLGRPFQEPLGIPRKGDAGRDEEEPVEGDEDAVEVVFVEPDQDVLEGGKNQEHPEEGAVVAEPRGGQRDEFPQGPKGQQAEQHDADLAAQDECRGQQRAEQPPGSHPPIEGINHGWIQAGLGLPLQKLADCRRRCQQQQHAAHKIPGVRVAQHLKCPSASRWLRGLEPKTRSSARRSPATAAVRR